MANRVANQVANWVANRVANRDLLASTHAHKQSNPTAFPTTGQRSDQSGRDPPAYLRPPEGEESQLIGWFVSSTADTWARHQETGDLRLAESSAFDHKNTNYKQTNNLSCVLIPNMFIKIKQN